MTDGEDVGMMLPELGRLVGAAVEQGYVSAETFDAWTELAAEDDADPEAFKEAMEQTMTFDADGTGE